jgi:hypothetical protein
MKRAIPSTRDTQEYDCNGEFHVAKKTNYKHEKDRNNHCFIYLMPMLLP